MTGVQTCALPISFLRAHDFFKDFGRIVDFSATLAPEVAAEKGLQHQDQWKSPIVSEPLPENVGAYARLLNHWYTQFKSSIRLPACHTNASAIPMPFSMGG